MCVCFCPLYMYPESCFPQCVLQPLAVSVGIKHNRLIDENEDQPGYNITPCNHATAETCQKRHARHA